MKFAILFNIVVFATSSSADILDFAEPNVIADREWEGQNKDNTCGMQISGDSMVNSTCTLTGSNITYAFAGNGAFITGPDTVTGYDDISGHVDMVVFFSQNCQSGECDNSTCWDASVDCVDNGQAVDGTFFMETVNEHRGKKGNFNLQIFGVSTGSLLNIHLKNHNNEGFAVNNITAPFGEITNASEDAWGNMKSNDGQFSVQVGNEDFGDLFQISIAQHYTRDTLDLWKSSVELIDA